MMLPADWMPVDGFTLEPNAISAVTTAQKHVAVIAGPGAGKTEMLAQKADFLFRTGECAFPRKILAISFKVDAASNLRERVRRRCGGRLAARLDSHTFHAFANRILRRFGAVLTGDDQISPNFTVGLKRTSQSHINYKDLVPLAIKVVKTSSAARHAVRQTYSHVFLDEFQDCTTQQYALVRELFATSGAIVTAVGDNKQMIMLWAGAQAGNFGLLQKDFVTTPLTLYQNFRAKPRLRRMQNAMIADMDPGAALPMSQICGAGGAVDVVCFKDDVEEALYLAGMIQNLIGSGADPSEIAVLVPQVPHQFAAPLTKQLAGMNIPYRNEQESQDLATEPVASLIFDFLRVAGGLREAQAYERLMKISKWRSTSDAEELSKRSRIERYLKASRSQLRGQRQISSRLLHMLVEGFLDTLDRDSLADISFEYQGIEGLDEVVDKTLTELDRQLSSGEELQAALRNMSKLDAVRILTTHKSKGLEFDHVIMLGVEEESYFGDDPDQNRNAFFVGISRARDHLVLTTASRRAVTQPNMTWWRERRRPHKDFLSYSVDQ